MKRFSHLEFGDKSKDRPQRSAGSEQLRDEEYFHNEAERYRLAGDFEVALRNYSRALEQNSSFYPGWLGQVLMLIELGEYREADVWADKALEMFPEYPELLAVKAVACARDGKMEKAVRYSDNSVSKDDITSTVWLARAEVLLNRKSRVAENCIRKAVSIAGNSAPLIRLEAGRLLNKKGSYYVALEYLRSAADGLPNSALALYELGYCQAKLGRAEATATLEHAHRLHPHWHLPKEALRRFAGRGFLRRLFGR